nr:prephenate dehydrogenase [Candidatus Omnitrophota bacterium]
GLIGGSAGKALIARGLAKEVVGICRRESSAERALKEKAVTSAVVGGYDSNCREADIVLVATPVNAIIPALEKLADCDMGADTAVTDAGSTKGDIVLHASKLEGKLRFVGSHPMAGSEKSGVENSSASLFEGSVCLLTPDASTKPEVKKKISDFWIALGAEVREMSPGDHDRGVAFSSHLPHAAAYALAGTLEEKLPRYLFAGGFRDTTRVASSDAALWSEIFDSNRGNVLKAIEKYREKLGVIEEEIRSGRKKDLLERLERWRKLRDEIV